LRSTLTKIAYGLALTPKEPHGANPFSVEDQTRPNDEIRNIVKHGSEYNQNKNGVLDEKELVLAMETEAKKSMWHRFNSLFSTHPSTYKRILFLSQIVKEMSSGEYTVENIYKKAQKIMTKNLA
jgi:Zn-dependent protease with chaperone function